MHCRQMRLFRPAVLETMRLLRNGLLLAPLFSIIASAQGPNPAFADTLRSTSTKLESGRATIWFEKESLSAAQADDFGRLAADGIVNIERLLGVQMDSARFGTNRIEYLVSGRVREPRIYDGPRPFVMLPLDGVKSRSAPYLALTVPLIAGIGAMLPDWFKDGFASYVADTVRAAYGGYAALPINAEGKSIEAHARSIASSGLGRITLPAIGANATLDLANSNQPVRDAYFTLAHAYAKFVALRCSSVVMLMAARTGDVDGAIGTCRSPSRLRAEWIASLSSKSATLEGAWLEYDNLQIVVAPDSAGTFIWINGGDRFDPMAKSLGFSAYLHPDRTVGWVERARAFLRQPIASGDTGNFRTSAAMTFFNDNNRVYLARRRIDGNWTRERFIIFESSTQGAEPVVINADERRIGAILDSIEAVAVRTPYSESFVRQTMGIEYDFFDRNVKPARLHPLYRPAEYPEAERQMKRSGGGNPELRRQYRWQGGHVDGEGRLLAFAAFPARGDAGVANGPVLPSRAKRYSHSAVDTDAVHVHDAALT